MFRSQRKTWSLYQQAYCSSSFTIPDKCYIDGKWIPSEIPDCSDADTQLAISAAKKAFQSWKTSTVKRRSGILKKAHDLHKKYSKELSNIMTEEGGKVITQSMGEVLYGASYFEWFAEEVRRVYGEVLSPPMGDRQTMIFREPAGVAAIITPWNFPNAMLARKVAAVIAAGCTCVIKPAEDTPYSALAIVKILEECGVPPGVVNIVTSSKENAPTIGKTLSKSPDVRIMSFTGSTAVGKILMEQSASTVKKIGMELGGNAPFIVFESADMKKAIDGAIASKFRHSGQTCVCSNQFLIQENVHDEFVEKLLDKMNKSLILGDPTNEKTTIGPLINKQALEKIHEHIVTTLLRIGIGSRRYTYDMRTNYSDSSTSSGLS
ncbi:Succinate-semialdehyde dehydrogenase, mitochondrial [Nymphon striatum]|nr:Succinate-semialdehyde dehydrogenase, mitochondrial [Nymphon striatum]